MKELIAVEYWEVETQVNKVIELVKVINSHTDKLNKCGVVLTIEDIKAMSINKDEYSRQIYLDELQKVCEMFAQDFEEVSKWEYTLKHGENMFRQMAIAKCKPLLALTKDVNILSTFGDSLYLKYIEIENNIASPKLNFEEDIKEYYSHYAKNDKQNKLTKALKTIQNAISEATKLGYSSFEIMHFINATDNQIKYNAIERIK